MMICNMPSLVSKFIKKIQKQSFILLRRNPRSRFDTTMLYSTGSRPGRGCSDKLRKGRDKVSKKLKSVVKAARRGTDKQKGTDKFRIGKLDSYRNFSENCYPTEVKLI